MNQYGYQQRSNPMEDLKKFFRDSSILPRLIIINVSVWFLIQISLVVCFMFNCESCIVDTLIPYFAIPADPELIIRRPWTFITSLFLHVDFMHILFNMLWLYWFGKIFLQYLNKRQMIATFFFGGLAGGILFFLAYNYLPVFISQLEEIKIQDPSLEYDPRLAYGASASIMAIVTAISFYVPNYTIRLLFIGNVRIFYLAIALFIMDFFMIQHDNPGGHIAHIGGAIYGFLYVYYLRKGKDFSKLFPRFTYRRKMGHTIKRKPRSKTKEGSRPVSDVEYNKVRASKQKKIDGILDKISRSGYESLTKEEKELLFNQSNKK